MGLCKCERRRVTNLFCFEHRVNVCEFCMVSSHERCIVKSYLRWLKDCDFTPSCGICRERFDESDKECVRLVCLDVFHQDCMINLLESAPPTTAPAGFVCPCCGECIIPQSNHGGPVAEALRTLLQKVRWPSGQQPDLRSYECSLRPTTMANAYFRNSSTPDSGEGNKLLDPRVDVAARHFLSGHDVRMADLESRTTTVDPIDRLPREQTPIAVSTHSPKSQRREPHSVSSCVFAGRFDDEDKYKRRVALSSVFRVLKSNLSQYCMLVRPRRRRSLLFVVLLFVTMLVLFSTYGRSSDRVIDSLFDPHMNPNIRLKDGAVDAVRAGLNVKRAELNGEQ